MARGIIQKIRFELEDLESIESKDVINVSNNIDSLLNELESEIDDIRRASDRINNW